MNKFKKHIRLILGIILLILGIGFMVIPFIPIGYIIIFVAIFFLATYIPALKRFLTYLKKKDKKGRLKKVEKKIEDLENTIKGEGDKDKEDKTPKRT